MRRARPGTDACDSHLVLQDLGDITPLHEEKCVEARHLTEEPALRMNTERREKRPPIPDVINNIRDYIRRRPDPTSDVQLGEDQDNLPQRVAC